MERTDKQLVDDLNSTELVVEDTLKFKSKLKIGEDSYETLKLAKTLKTLWDVKGAAAAGGAAAASPAVAGAFFGGSSGFLSFLGIGAAAATPVGWVVAASVGSAAAYYGAMQLWSKYQSSRVDTIPKFINTPIDLLGATIFDMMSGLALKVAFFSGEIEDSEREAIVGYFKDVWGISPEYGAKALPLVESRIREIKLKDMVAALAEQQMDNPDCRPAAMRKEVRQFVEEIALADGVLDEREELAIEAIEFGLEKHLASHRQVARGVSKAATAVSTQAQALAAATPDTADIVRGASAVAEDMTKVAQGFHGKARSALSKSATGNGGESPGEHNPGASPEPQTDEGHPEAPAAAPESSSDKRTTGSQRE